VKIITDEEMIQHAEDTLITPLVLAAADERTKTELENRNHYINRLKEQLKGSFRELQTRLKTAVQHLINQGLWPLPDERYQAAMELFCDETKLKEKINQGKFLQEILHFTNEEIANFYVEAVELFHRAHYQDACHVFLLLTQFNPMISHFWTGLALSEEKCGELQEAFNAYLFAAGLAEDTLVPYMDAARCLILLNRKEDAKKLLQEAYHRAEAEEQLASFKKDIQTQLASIA
jgi:type III secretion system low calcium response chaperone LcrH/SycD